MIIRVRGPRRRVMAERAILRKSRRCVIRILDVIVPSQVAGYTRCLHARVFSVNVAGRTLLACMRPGQREFGCVMAERGRSP